jgi:hypothetical protein
MSIYHYRKRLFTQCLIFNHCATCPFAMNSDNAYNSFNCAFIQAHRMLTDAIKAQIREIHQRIKTTLPGYQPRPSQNKLVAEMANIVAGAYHSYDRIGLIEAGTGTGKSLAYFLAAVPLALSK